MIEPVNPSIPSRCDVLVIGSGAAGLYAALCLPSHYQICLVTKDELKTGASDWAQGGIAAAINPSDSAQLHLQDTLKAGAGLCDLKAVEFLVNHAASAIQSLVNLGVSFDRKGEELAMTLEAAHSRPRVLHAADRTGRAIISTLTAKVLEKPNIKIISQTIALQLWLQTNNKRCIGASLLHGHQIRWIRASAVILATGGGGQVFAQTTNPSVSTGDGVALAWRAGAMLRDLEFFQFHPTALTLPNAPRFLISEAVRGEGAHLVDELGDRFVFQYHPDGELAPRDVVSRAIFTHLQRTTLDPSHAHVYLDLRMIEPERVRYRFPNIIRLCQKWGIDVFHDLIPVAPAAHYWMGGIAAGLDNQTSIAGLYAIGETASTGIHGANRLASNSLLECVVFAGQLAHLVLEKEPFEEIPVREEIHAPDWDFEKQQIDWVREQLPILMWQNVGISRSHEPLEMALIQVNEWRKQLYELKISQVILHSSPEQKIVFKSSLVWTELRNCIETLNLLDIAYLILKSALFRTESRGGHYRLDYPDSSSAWQVHTIIEKDHTDDIKTLHLE
nr:L-aspartate oxidase [Aphanothece hegewaldii]